MDKCFGRDWKTTLCGCLFAAGSTLALAVPSGQWHVIGQVAAAVGGSLGLGAAKDSRRQEK
jgi:hypothetical protein